jgi:hypothetical protein
MAFRDIRKDLLERIEHAIKQSVTENEEYIKTLERLELQHKQEVKRLAFERATCEGLIAIEQEREDAWPNKRLTGPSDSEEVAEVLRKIFDRDKSSNIHRLGTESLKRLTASPDETESPDELLFEIKGAVNH